MTGQFDTIAVRLCRIPAVIELCERTGFALTSTSCNLTGQEPCRTADEVKLQFGVDFPVLEADTGEKSILLKFEIFYTTYFRQG
ncbi:SUA5/yciO/yrdC domain-containing protein [Actinobacillus equuli]|nr:SUA5/yciO/yrdC domain-containing protein [Actinobacillus equuli]